MRKNLERNPILRKQQSQRKRFGSKSLDPKIEFEKKNLKKNIKMLPLKIPQFYKMKQKLKFKSQLMEKMSF